MIPGYPKAALLAVYLFASVCLLVAGGSVCNAGDVKAGRTKALMPGMSRPRRAFKDPGCTKHRRANRAIHRRTAASVQIRCAKERRDVRGCSIFVRHGHRGSCSLFFGNRDQCRQDAGWIAIIDLRLARRARRAKGTELGLSLTTTSS